MAEMKMCQHCKRKTARRPRGLCDPCYYDVSIRHLYKPAYPQVQTSGLTLPSQPTNAYPGSAEKVAVMRERVDRGEHLFHPEDFNTLPQLFEELHCD